MRARKTEPIDHTMSPEELRSRGAVAFDQIDRREYVFPSTAQQILDLITLDPRELNGGVITEVGIDSPQFDWFGAEDYLFTTQRVQPTGQQLINSDGTVASGIQFYSLRGVGSCENPSPTRIRLLQRYTWSLVIRAKAGVPATGFAVANLYVRTKGFFLR